LWTDDSLSGSLRDMLPESTGRVVDMLLPVKITTPVARRK
jgi:hypothetical protein